MNHHASAGNERIPTHIHARAQQASAAVAREIANLIRLKAAEGKPWMLGLPAGSTPTGVYAELVRLHQQERLSFANAISFKLDEYFPMQPHEAL